MRRGPAAQRRPFVLRATQSDSRKHNFEGTSKSCVSDSTPTMVGPGCLPDERPAAADRLFRGETPAARSRRSRVTSRACSILYSHAHSARLRSTVLRPHPMSMASPVSWLRRSVASACRLLFGVYAAAIGAQQRGVVDGVQPSASTIKATTPLSLRVTGRNPCGAVNINWATAPRSRTRSQDCRIRNSTRTNTVGCTPLSRAGWVTVTDRRRRKFKSTDQRRPRRQRGNRGREVLANACRCA